MERSAGNGIRTVGDIIYAALGDERKYNAVSEILDNDLEMARFIWRCRAAGAEGVIGLLIMTLGSETIVAIPLGAVIAADGYSKLKRQLNILADAALNDVKRGAEGVLN